MKTRILATLFFLAASALTGSLRAQERELSAAQKLQLAQNLIERFYVEEVDADTLVTEAIKGMLSTLDPHSQYSDPQETKDLTTGLDGGFSGVGIQFNLLNDSLLVVQTTSGGPSEKVGILPGDRILSADGKRMSGAKVRNSDVQKALRGPKGTKVDLRVLRGTRDTLDFTVVRDDIPLYTVDAAYMVSPEAGYIRLSRFGETSAREVREAIERLQAQGMKDLVLDLNDNGGGYLGAAFGLGEIFLPKGSRVVSTKGLRSPEMVYTVEGDEQLLPDGRLVLMVNQYSASASEITAGAIQDNDRGVLVGRRTFGKGLVQRPFTFPDGSMIRLTTSRYYTPTGRPVQKPYVKGRQGEYARDIADRLHNGELMSADSLHLPDSLRFETLRLHRPVYGGGGLVPDVFVPLDTALYTPYYRRVMAKGTPYQWALTYLGEHRDALKARYPTADAFVEAFEVTPEMIESLTTRAKEKDGVELNAEELQTSLPVLSTLVKALIGRDLYDGASTSTTFYRILNPLYPDYRRAIELIADHGAYDAILSPAP